MSAAPSTRSAAAGLVTSATDAALSTEALELPGELEEVKAAIEHFKKGNRQAALESLRSAAKKDPALPPPTVILSRMLLFEGNLAEARPLLEATARDLPRFPGTFALLGNIALHEGRVADAEALYEKTLRLANDANADPALKKHYAGRGHAGLAAVAELRRDWAKAKSALTAWLQVDPSSSQARHRLGRALFHLGDRKAAESELRQASKSDPKLELPEVTLGELARDNQDRDAADAWFHEAVQKHADDPRALLALASWQLKQGELNAAAENARSALVSAPANRQVKFLLGLISRQRGEFALAEQCLSEILHDAPGDYVASNQLAVVLADQKLPEKLQKALQLAEVNFRQYPQNPQATATLGWVHFQMGRIGEAERAWQNAIQGGQALPDTAYYFARLQFSRGNADEARRLLKEVLTAPRDEFAHWQDAQDWWTESFAKSNSRKSQTP